MQFNVAALLAFAAAASAAAVQNGSPVENIVARAGEAGAAYTAVGNCKAGTYDCATIVSGGKTVCKSCAIAVGNSANKCQLNNLCRQADNSCQVIGGQPHCT